MNFKELIDNVTNRTNLPRDQVKKVLEAQASCYADLIQRQENFTCPQFGFKSIINASTGRKAAWIWLPQPKD
ncbi:MAG: HU family DNA-binding protein [Cyanobacteriota bacterium]|nr:HU family DNA-binding protein [Cyanobacteriota bacterium]